VSDDLTLVPLGPFAFEAAPTSIDARCGRLRFQPKNGQIVCCARGACIDGRARLEIVARASLRWSSEGPMQHDPAPSGIVERLADVRLGEVVACAALDDVRGGVRGDACGIRRLAREANRREDEWLLARDRRSDARAAHPSRPRAAPQDVEVMHMSVMHHA